MLTSRTVRCLCRVDGNVMPTYWQCGQGMLPVPTSRHFFELCVTQEGQPIAMHARARMRACSVRYIIGDRPDRQDVRFQQRCKQMRESGGENMRARDGCLGRFKCVSECDVRVSIVLDNVMAVTPACGMNLRHRQPM